MIDDFEVAEDDPEAGTYHSKAILTVAIIPTLAALHITVCIHSEAQNCLANTDGNVLCLVAGYDGNGKDLCRHTYGCQASFSLKKFHIHAIWNFHTTQNLPNKRYLVCSETQIWPLVVVS